MTLPHLILGGRISFGDGYGHAGRYVGITLMAGDRGVVLDRDQVNDVRDWLTAWLADDAGELGTE